MMNGADGGCRDEGAQRRECCEEMNRSVTQNEEMKRADDGAAMKRQSGHDVKVGTK